ncbi:hypothetical protein MXB_5382 [Myxobolus squamalis]|nr:hypothetical protein MXB_5382 [Myxobolus squamalis]
MGENPAAVFDKKIDLYKSDEGKSETNECICIILTQDSIKNISDCYEPECQHLVELQQLKIKFIKLDEKYKKTKLVLKKCQKLYSDIEKTKSEEIDKSNAQIDTYCTIM